MSMEKTKMKFNVIDIIVLLLVLLMVAGLVWFFFFRTSTTTVDKQVDVEYTIIIKSIDKDYIKNFKNNDEIKNSSTGNVFGTITKIEAKSVEVVTDSYHTDENGNNIANTTTHEEFKDVFITIKGKAFVSEQGIYLVDGNKLLTGTKLNIKDNAYAHEAYVISFSAVK